MQVEIDTAVHVQSLEIGENRGSWSIVGIKAWDTSTNLWQTLYKGEADVDRYEFYKATYQYNKFVPSPFCETTFKTSIIRIELDTYSLDDWNELDYVKVIGATEIKAGVLNADVATQVAWVMYLPDPDFNGADSFRFQGCDCAYDSARTSEETITNIMVGAVNDRPIAQSSSASVECAPGVADILTLHGDDIDADTNSTTALIYSIDTLPDGATLADATTGEVINAAVLPASLSGSGAKVQLLVNYSIDEPPSTFTFEFSTTDEHGAVSASAATVTVTCRATQCNPGNYFDMGAKECSSCPAGTFASSTAVRSSCDSCATGKFAPSEGSESCGTCANGQVTLAQGSRACDLCPAGATCMSTSSLAVNPGMWCENFDSLDVYECPLGARACPGGNTTYSCTVGYGGVLCAVCQPGFIPNAGSCADCDSLNAPTTVLILAVAAVMMAFTVRYLVRNNKGIAAAMESVSFSVPIKIYFATIQIIGTYAALLSDVLFEPLKGFLGNLTFATDLAELFGGFGVSCANHELRTFKARLIISTLAPIVLSLCIGSVFLCRVLWLHFASPSHHPNHVRALRQGTATLVLLLLYITLPSTSTMVFKTFVRDSRPLGPNGEQYLIADYAGELRGSM
jgi:hypothetical protein